MVWVFPVFVVVVSLALHQLITWESSSSVRPSRVSDFNATATGSYTLSLNWTAPQEHVDTSTVNGYEIRMSENESQLTQTDFDEGMMVLSLLDSRQRSELYVQPGTKIFVDVSLEQDLVPDLTYYLALRAVDALGNWSPVSNHAKVRVESKGLLPWIISCLLWIIGWIWWIIKWILCIFFIFFLLYSCAHFWRIYHHLKRETEESIRSIEKFISLFDTYQQEVHEDLDKLRTLAKNMPLDLERVLANRWMDTGIMGIRVNIDTFLLEHEYKNSFVDGTTADVIIQAEKIKENVTDKIKEISAALRDASKHVEQLIKSAEPLTNRFTFTAKVGVQQFLNCFLNSYNAMTHFVPEILKTAKILPAKTTTKVLPVAKIVSGSLAGIFLALDIKDVVVNSNKLKNGCKSEVVEQINRVVDHLKSIMDDLHSQYVKCEDTLNTLVI